jgi:hypothetical protein
MNRIYQGRVTKIDILSEDRKNPTVVDTFEGCELDQSSPLWKHHETFQSAVNYYIVALASLARGISPRENDPSPEQRLASDLLNRVHKSWENFPRSYYGAVPPKSLRTSLKDWLQLDDSSSANDAFNRILKGNDSPAATLHQALFLLLDKCGGESAIQQGGRGYLPRICDATYTGSWDLDTTAIDSSSGKDRLAATLHSEHSSHDITKLANEMSVSWAGIKCKPNEKISGDPLRKRLEETISHQLKRIEAPDTIALRQALDLFPDAQDELQRIKASLPILPDSLELDLNKGGNISWDLVHSTYLFKAYPSPFTAKLLSLSIKKPTSSTKANITKSYQSLEDDPIKLARSTRGYIFPAFTALPAWSPVSPGKPVWKEFDIAAFKEALKSLNQFNQKTIERAENRAYLKGRIAVLLGSKEDSWKPRKTESGETEDLPKPLDPTLLKLADRLEERLTNELADTVVNRECAKILTFGQATRTLIPGQWQLSTASLRGFSDIAKQWNKLLDQKGDSVSEDDLAAVVKEQQQSEKNKKSIGSISLFLALCDSEFHPLWREDGKTDADESDRLTSNRILHKVTELHQAIRDYERAQEPINLTPAEPRKSRRLYMFSDIGGKEKVIFKNSNVIETSLALFEGSGCAIRRVHLHYSAPRLKRDELIGGETSHWLQPMTKALGIEPAETSPKFESAVSLMPDFTSNGETRFLLNFPKTLDSTWIHKALGKSAIWNGQFNGIQNKNIHLHWPATASTKPSKENPWWKNPAVLKSGFTLLSVDLGQRTAGAWALINVTSWKPESNKPVRSIGYDGSREWFAEIQQTGMHRLPGEDQQVLAKGGRFTREISGKAGRNSSEDEYQNALKLCQDLGCSGSEEAKAWIGKTVTEKSLPEQNDSLLVLANRRLSRLATFHRWSCLRRALSEKSDDSKSQIRMIASTLAELSYWQDAEVKNQLKQLIEDYPYLETLLPETDPTNGNTKKKRRSTSAKSWSTVELAAWQNEFHPDHFAGFSSAFGTIQTSYRDSLLQALMTLANRVTPVRGKTWNWKTRTTKDQDTAPYGELLLEEIRGEKTPLIRGQRGLSIARLEQLESLRTLFLRINRAMDKLPGKLSKAGYGFTTDAGEPCPELLEKIERMKEQRVNQTAHLILAQALGVRLKAEKQDTKTRRESDIHGEYEPIPGHRPADFIVIENLDRYLTTQGRAPSENRRLMKWAHRAVRDKIKMLAEEPFGINVVEAPAAYSSRYCARTASPGSRCVEKAGLDPFTRDQLLKKSGAAPSPGHPDLRALYQTLLGQFEQLDQANRERRSSDHSKPPHTLILPKPGGPLFLSVAESPLIQADANAAINIGLRGIAAPQAIDILHKIRTQTHQDKIHAAKNKHTEKNAREKACYTEGTVINTPSGISRSSKSKGSPNFFYLPDSALPHYNFDIASIQIGSKKHHLVSGVALHTLTDAAVLERITAINSQRLSSWGIKQNNSPSPDSSADDDPDDQIPI